MPGQRRLVLAGANTEGTTIMSDPQTDSRRDVSLLQQAVNAFLKDAMPYFALDACADAIMRSLLKIIPGGVISGSLWGPGQRPNTSYKLAREGDTVVHREIGVLDLPRHSTTPPPL